MAVTDRYANYCINALQEMKINILDSVQVIGFYGAKGHQNEQLHISTIRHPVEKLESAAIENLVNIIKNDEVENKIFSVDFINAKITK